MTNLVSVDIFDKGLDLETTVQHPAGTPVMLAFVNIAGNSEVLEKDDGTLLTRALSLLANNLHERGTVVVALSDFCFNRPQLKGDLYELVLLLWEVQLLLYRSCSGGLL